MPTRIVRDRVARPNIIINDQDLVDAAVAQVEPALAAEIAAQDLATKAYVDANTATPEVVNPLVDARLAEEPSVVEAAGIAAAAAVDADPTIEDITAAISGSADSTRTHRLHHAITIAASDTPAWMKRMADYVCDGTDDHIEWQAALDEARPSLTRSMSVKLLPGSYYLADTVDWGPIDITGGGGNVAHGVRVWWAGASDGTAINVTNGSAGAMRNISFRGGVDDVHPGTWIDFTGVNLDKFKQLNNVHLSHSTGPLVKIAGWWNLQWRDVRFDDWGTYAIDIRPGQWPIHMPFVIDGFTADQKSDTSNLGLIYIESPDAGGSNAGAFVIRSGRYEVNSVLDGPKAIIHLKHGTTVTSGSIDIRLENFSYQDGTDQDGTCILYRDTDNTTAMDRLTLSGVSMNGMKSVLGGTWPSSVPEIPMQSRFPYLNIGGTPNIVDELHLRSSSSVNSTPLAIRSGSDGEDRVRVNYQGRMYFGDGTSAPDVHLRRSGVATLRVDPNLIVTSAATIGGALDHDGTTIGFYGATPTTKPTVTGSWADGSAGASLAAALEGLGLLVDDTTA